MPKTRNSSQIIGERGEAIFCNFALRTGLLPNKSVYDYGIDFICQVTDPYKPKVQKVLGEYIGVNVKTSETVRVRATIDRSDLEFAIQSSLPILFILIGLRDSKIYYRFFDINLLEVFDEILKSDQKTFLLRPDIMEEDVTKFLQDIKLYTSPFYKNRVHTRYLELGLEADLGKIQLHINEDHRGRVGVLDVYSFEKLFDISKPQFDSVKDGFLTHNFCSISLPADSLKESVLNLDNEFSTVAIRTLVPEGEVQTVKIRKNGENLISCKFETRCFQDESGLYNPVGLSIVTSQRRQCKDGLYYHCLRIAISEDCEMAVFDCPEIVKFLKCCTPGAEISLDNGKYWMNIEKWSYLLVIGPIISMVDEVYKKISLPRDEIFLHFINNDAMLTSISFLHSLLTAKIFNEEKPFGFILNDNETKIIWKEANIICPFIVPLPNGSYIIEISYGEEVGIEQGKARPVGIKLKQFNEVLEWTMLKDDKETVEFPYLMIAAGLSVKFTDKGINKSRISIDASICYTFN